MSRLEEIKARLEAVTPGPWKAWDRGIGYEIHCPHDEPINSRCRDTIGLGAPTWTP